MCRCGTELPSRSWFLARPLGFAQLASSFAAVWDDVLPPTPQHVWDANLAQVVRGLDG